MTIFFAIGFVGRQGSSYLEGLLHSHPQASCLGEIFAPGALSQTTSIPDYLDENVVNATCAASGFKLSIFHIQDKPDIVPVLRERNYRIVRLRRENKLDQFISMRLAQLNNKWRSQSGVYEITRFRETPEEIDYYYDQITTKDRELSQALNGFPTLDLSYEDLRAPGGHLPVLEFLGLPDAPVTSPFRQQHHGSQRETIENYDELKAYYSETELAQYFVD